MKQLEIRRDDECAQCRAALSAGTVAYWDRTTKTVHCATGAERAGHGTVTDAALVAPATLPATSPAAGWAAVGGSAQREYERRAARDRARSDQRIAQDSAWRVELQAKRPVLGRIITAVTPKPTRQEPQSTTAWKTGAAGERRVAEVLTGVPGIAVLHDRVRPGARRANIDHIVVSSWVYAFDAAWARRAGGVHEVTRRAR
jgi:hypothetical protein